MPSQNHLYAAKWDQFTHLDHTQDSLAAERRGWRRWLLMPYVAFIIPVEDPAVVAQLTAWQNALRPWFQYDPQPVNRLHITLHYVGGLQKKFRWWMPYTWQRAALPALADRVRPVLQNHGCFEIQIGPLNVFSNVLIAEVQDDHQCLRLLRAKLRRALPLRARPPSPWPYLPHVTLGYWGEQPAAPIAKVIRAFRAAQPLPLEIKHIYLTVYSLDTAPPRRDVLITAQEEIIADYTLQG